MRDSSSSHPLDWAGTHSEATSSRKQISTIPGERLSDGGVSSQCLENGSDGLLGDLERGQYSCWMEDDD